MSNAAEDVRWIEPDRDAGAPWRVICSLRSGGVSGAPWGSLNLAGHVGDAAAAVAENRRRLRAALRCPPIQWLRQVHGVGCVEVPAGGLGNEPVADAAWTRSAGVTLALLTADCLPVALWGHGAAGEPLVGLAHAGWRGLTAGVLERLLEQMPTAPQRLQAWIGPAISGAAYQVGVEVCDAVAAMPRGEALLAEAAWRDPDAPGRYRLDLATVARRQLEDLGVAAVTGGDCCTLGDGGFFSHRRDGVTGRQATLAWLA